MVSAIRVSDIVAEVKTLLESIDGAVRIATAFAILMGMIVLAGSVVATRRQRARDIVLLRLVGATRGEVARSQLIEFLRLLSAAVALAAFGAGSIAARLVVDLALRIPVQPGLAEPGADPAGRHPAGRFRRLCWRQFRRLTPVPRRDCGRSRERIPCNPADFGRSIASERNVLWLLFRR